jgi:hypothetical protein
MLKSRKLGWDKLWVLVKTYTRLAIKVRLCGQKFTFKFSSINGRFQCEMTRWRSVHVTSSPTPRYLISHRFSTIQIALFLKTNHKQITKINVECGIFPDVLTLSSEWRHFNSNVMLLTFFLVDMEHRRIFNSWYNLSMSFHSFRCTQLVKIHNISITRERSTVLPYQRMKEPINLILKRQNLLGSDHVVKNRLIAWHIVRIVHFLGGKNKKWWG